MVIIIIIIIKAINFTCYSSLLIRIFDFFFFVMETSINEPSVQTPVATQANGVIPTKVEASTATHASTTTEAEEATVAELPLVPPCKVSMIVPVSGTCNGRKKSVI